jgi:SPP1 family predicted phage head-tail adaptor
VPLRIDKMDTLVDVESTTTGHGTSGDPTDTWAKDKDIWAWVRELKGQEVWAAKATQTRNPRVVHTHYDTDLTGKIRLVIGSITYRVLSVVPDDTRSSMDLYCEEWS